jgi:hypothetical protein
MRKGGTCSLFARRRNGAKEIARGRCQLRRSQSPVVIGERAAPCRTARSGNAYRGGADRRRWQSARAGRTEVKTSFGRAQNVCRPGLPPRRIRRMGKASGRRLLMDAASQQRLVGFSSHRDLPTVSRPSAIVQPIAFIGVCLRWRSMPRCAWRARPTLAEVFPRPRSRPRQLAAVAAELLGVSVASPESTAARGSRNRCFFLAAR